MMRFQGADPSEELRASRAGAFPVASIGDSMLVYHLQLEEVNLARISRGMAKVQQMYASPLRLGGSQSC